MKKSPKTLVYQCKIFRVWEEEFPLANGKKTRQSWVDHNPTVAIVPFNHKNELLLIKQYRNAIKRDFLEIPAGSIESPGESPRKCAQRELAEETGFKAKTLVKLFEGYLLPGYCNEYMHFFLAKDLIHAPLRPDDDEIIEPIPTRLLRAQKLILTGKIRDVKTVLGIMLAEKYLKKNLL